MPKELVGSMFYPPVFLLLAACSSMVEQTDTSLKARAAAYVGLPANQLVADKGTPLTKATLSSGDEYWSYRVERVSKPADMLHFVVGRDRTVRSVALN